MKSFYVTKKTLFFYSFLFLLGIGMIFSFPILVRRSLPAIPVQNNYYQPQILGSHPEKSYDILTIAVPVEEKMENSPGDLMILAQLCQAEAGNQGIDGMRLVADVVLNRVDSHKFPNTIEEVIYDPGQFGVITDGAFERAGKHIREDSYLAAEMEYFAEERLDSGVLYFNNSPECSGTNHVKIGGHWFGY